MGVTGTGLLSLNGYKSARKPHRKEETHNLRKVSRFLFNSEPHTLTDQGLLQCWSPARNLRFSRLPYRELARRLQASWPTVANDPSWYINIESTHSPSPLWIGSFPLRMSQNPQRAILRSSPSRQPADQTRHARSREPNVPSCLHLRREGTGTEMPGWGCDFTKGEW